MCLVFFFILRIVVIIFRQLPDKGIDRNTVGNVFHAVQFPLFFGFLGIGISTELGEKPRNQITRGGNVDVARVGTGHLGQADFRLVLFPKDVFRFVKGVETAKAFGSEEVITGLAAFFVLPESEEEANTQEQPQESKQAAVNSHSVFRHLSQPDKPAQAGGEGGGADYRAHCSFAGAAPHEPDLRCGGVHELFPLLQESFQSSQVAPVGGGMVLRQVGGA